MRKKTGKIAGFLGVILMTACLSTGRDSLRNIAGTQISSHDAVPDTLDRESLLEPGTQRLSENGVKRLMKWMRQTDKWGGTLYINLRTKTKKIDDIVGYLEQFGGPFETTRETELKFLQEQESRAKKYVPPAKSLAQKFNDLRQYLHPFFNDIPDDTTDIQIAYAALQSYKEQLDTHRKQKQNCEKLQRIYQNFISDYERYSKPPVGTPESSIKVWKRLLPDTAIMVSRSRLNFEDCQNDLVVGEANLPQVTQTIFELYDKINDGLQEGLTRDTELTHEMENLIKTLSQEFKTEIKDLKLKE